MWNIKKKFWNTTWETFQKKPYQIIVVVFVVVFFVHVCVRACVFLDVVFIVCNISVFSLLLFWHTTDISRRKRKTTDNICFVSCVYKDFIIPLNVDKSTHFTDAIDEFKTCKKKLAQSGNHICTISSYITCFWKCRILYQRCLRKINSDFFFRIQHCHWESKGEFRNVSIAKI